MSAPLILVFNCGSSSIKVQAINPQSKEVAFKFTAEEVENYEKSIDQILSKISDEIKAAIVGVGHRVVHGGEYFKSSALITKETLEKIKACNTLAPLHNPYNVLGIEKLQHLFKVPHVAVFDTAFHSSMPDRAALYPIDYKLYETHHIKRYGFHGTSHRFVSLEVARALGKPVEKTEFISAHLGGGCSLCAVVKGKSVETSMGFSPAEGLMMATRSGDVDPTLFHFLQTSVGMSSEEVNTLLNKQSGLLGVSGLSGDLRQIEEAITKGDRRACLSFEIFCYRLAKMIASYTILTPELDGLIFTGGIGENSDAVRARVVQWLDPLGFSLDGSQNKQVRRGLADVISGPESRTIYVQPTNEELMIAQDTFEVGVKGNKA